MGVRVIARVRERVSGYLLTHWTDCFTGRFLALAMGLVAL